MTKQPDVYTTLGQECGCCGHRHPTVREAGRCLEDYRRREFSDRIVVAVAADAPWPPTEGRYLNDAELEKLYADAGNRKAHAGAMMTTMWVGPADRPFRQRWLTPGCPARARF